MVEETASFCKAVSSFVCATIVTQRFTNRRIHEPCRNSGNPMLLLPSTGALWLDQTLNLPTPTALITTILITTCSHTLGIPLVRIASSFR